MKPFEELTERGQIQRFRRALIEVLAQYELDVIGVRFLAFDSRVVFRVDTATGRYVAKFHNSAEHEPSQTFGETQFLGYIAQKTALIVETPLANRQGALITAVDSQWLAEPANVVLFSWLYGRHLADPAPITAYESLGQCAGQLHLASSTFEPQPPFEILRNDKVFYWDEATLLDRPESDLLTADRLKMFAKGFALASAAIDAEWQDGQPIVIHNDLHPGNLKRHEDQLALFDFEDISWGFPAQDIGTAIYPIRFETDYPRRLAVFRKGYEQFLPWPFASEQELDRFVMARLIMFANYVVNYDIRPDEFIPKFAQRLELLLAGQTKQD